jgi:hypothetical protein
MCLKLGLVVFGDVDYPPQLVSEPVGFEVTIWLCQGPRGEAQQDSQQEDPTGLHTGSFLSAWTTG